MKIHKYILVPVILFLHGNIYSQKDSDIFFVNYTYYDDVRTIAPHGDTIWVGTTVGLQKRLIDGTVLQRYDKSNSGLPNNNINTIIIDSSGDKWIGTNNGLVQLSGNNFIISDSINSFLSNLPVLVIAIADNGVKWIGTDGGGIIKISDNSYTTYSTGNSNIPNDKINNITIDKNGDKWIRSDGILSKISGNSITISEFFYSDVPYTQIQPLAIDCENNIWLGTDVGLVKLSNDTTITLHSVDYNLPCHDITAIAIDKNGDKWIGTYTGGLARFSNDSSTIFNECNYNYQDGNTTIINTIAIDKNGDKWIGSNRGLQKLCKDTIFTFNSNSTLPLVSYLNTVAVDINGDILIGDYEGLTILSGNKSRVYNENNSILPAYTGVYSIAVENNGTKWIGTMMGITKYSNNTFLNLESDIPELPHFIANSIAIGENGHIWVGTGNGLVKYIDETFTLYNEDNSDLPDNDITSIAIEKNGTKWIGTSNNGLVKLSGNSFHIYNSNLPDNYITSIAIEENGTKWIGTKKGLAKFSNDTITVYDTTNSNLPDNNINALAVDQNGDKWICSNSGLVKLSNNIFTIYNTTNSNLPNNSVTAITVDSKKGAWIICKNILSQFDICEVPNIPDFISGISTPCIGSQYNFSIPIIPNATSYEWSLPSGVAGFSKTNEITLNFSSKAKSGKLTVTGINECNNGKSQTINITVKAVDTPQIETKWDEDILICPNTENTFTSYQWYKDEILIPGATNQYYQINKQPGRYFVRTENKNGCSSQSKTDTILHPTGMLSTQYVSSENIFPNPMQNKCTIRHKSNWFGMVYITLYNQLGQILQTSSMLKTEKQQEYMLNTNKLISGFYKVEIIANGESSFHTIEVIK